MAASSEVLERIEIVPAIIPVDSQTADNNGDWVKMDDARRLLAVVYKAIGIAGDDVVFTLRQATSAAGGSAKALNFTKAYHKLAVDITGLGTWTKVTQAAGNTYTNTDSAERAGLIVVEIEASMLDVANGFHWVQLQVPDTGAAGASLLCGFYILANLREEVTPASKQTMIA